MEGDEGSFDLSQEEAPTQVQYLFPFIDASSRSGHGQGGLPTPANYSFPTWQMWEPEEEPEGDTAMEVPPSRANEEDGVSHEGGGQGQQEKEGGTGSSGRRMPSGSCAGWGG